MVTNMIEANDQFENAHSTFGETRFDCSFDIVGANGGGRCARRAQAEDWLAVVSRENCVEKDLVIQEIQRPAAGRLRRGRRIGEVAEDAGGGGLRRVGGWKEVYTC